MKKLALLAIAGLGLVFMAQTCVILGATVVTVDDTDRYSAEMKNETAADILNHKFAVGFIEGGQAVATETVDGCLRSLQSGESNFFTADSDLEDDEVDTAVSRLVGPLTFGQVAEGDISFSNLDATFNEDTELVRVTGRITNDGNDELNNVRVCAVVRNDDGAITMVQHDNNEYDGFQEDDTQDFSVDVNVTDDADDADTVDVWVDGHNEDDGDKPTEPQSDLDNEIDVCEPTSTSTPVTNTATATNTPTTTPTATNTPTLPNAC
jgi:hypothetical protein